jgi:hypothetical protein
LLTALLAADRLCRGDDVNHLIFRVVLRHQVRNDRIIDLEHHLGIVAFIRFGVATTAAASSSSSSSSSAAAAADASRKAGRTLAPRRRRNSFLFRFRGGDGGSGLGAGRRAFRE